MATHGTGSFGPYDSLIPNTGPSAGELVAGAIVQGLAIALVVAGLYGLIRALNGFDKSQRARQAERRAAETRKAQLALLDSLIAAERAKRMDG